MPERRKKLIEVALPLEAINKESAREKSIRHGHPSTLHLWWARRPLAACRAVLFAQLVDDPDSDPAYRNADGSVDEDRAGLKRAQLFNLIEELVKWENSNNDRVINAARAEIARCVASRLIEEGKLSKETVVWSQEPAEEAEDRRQQTGESKRAGTGGKRAVSRGSDSCLLPSDSSAAGPRTPRGFGPSDKTIAWDMVTMNARPAAVNHFLANYAPPVLDPFAGGGSIPLEAQRLGLRAYASDLNPVAVLINKALIEIPPRFAGLPPVNPEARRQETEDRKERLQYHTDSCLQSPDSYRGAKGLAEDVRYYGKWMRDEAEKRIGHLYPKVKITEEMAKDRPDLENYVGQELTVIAWLWARTVKCNNPACGFRMPMLRSFWLSTKKGKEVWAMPILDRDSGTVHFAIRHNGTPPQETSNRTMARCLFCNDTMKKGELRKTASEHGMAEVPLAIVAEGTRGRVYLESNYAQVPQIEKPEVIETQQLVTDDKRWFSPPQYGLPTFRDLFTARQLTALTTFSDLVGEARAKVLADALGARASRPQKPIHDRGYLPHWEAGERPQSVTFRLHDSLPREVREQIAARTAAEALTSKGAPASRPHHRAHAPTSRPHGIPRAGKENEPPTHAAKMAALQPETASLQREAFEAALDAGYGACYLRDPAIARLVEDALLHFDGTRYTLHAWIIMPNHVHVLFTPLHDNSLSSILHTWKSFTAKQANKKLNRRGAFWQEEYFDRMIRDEKHFTTAKDYIEQNAVNAGLCQRAEAWPFGSAARADEKRAGRPRSQDDRPLAEGGSGPQAYADAVATYLAFGIDKGANYWSTLCGWHSGRDIIMSTFARQALPMVWDYAEANPLSQSSGNLVSGVEQCGRSLDAWRSGPTGQARQLDAASALNGVAEPLISTDPPYYDNIGYADLSDFFYVWLRRTLKDAYPQLLSTMLTPKKEEMIASPYRHDGSKAKAAAFFEEGLGSAIAQWRRHGCADYPTTIFYAFKQAETTTSGTASTGWETFLTGVIEHGFAITGTWPMRTELTGNLKKQVAALASSVVLACVPREADAPMATRREFLNALKRELPDAMRKLQIGNIAPVDLAQAAIGPGMDVFSRYSKVVESDGSSMSVRTALTLINQVLDEVLAEQEGEFDSDTRWAVAWFEQHGVQEGPYGVAETLSKAKNTSVQGLVDAGVVTARGGKVKLLARDEMPEDWDPATDRRLTAWEATQHLIRRLQDDGEEAAAELLARLGGDYGERARDLAYRLYSICERKGWAHEALAYNSLVIAWSEIGKLALAGDRRQKAEDSTLFE